MEKRIFSIILKILAIISIVFCIFYACMVGGFYGILKSCAEKQNYSEVEQGDWIYCYFYGKLYVKDLSESGKQKTVLVFPTEFNGQEVIGVRGRIKNDKLEVLYVTNHADYSNYECPNLSKVVLINWEGDPQYFGWVENTYCKIYVRNGVPSERTLYNIDYEIYFANTNFYYNYENSPRQGVYWIDNFDWGGKVEYLPKNPTREGYSFAGWYLEPECINKLDDNYSLPNEQLDESGEVLYQEVSLYAKWVENQEGI